MKYLQTKGNYEAWQHSPSPGKKGDSSSFQDRAEAAPQACLDLETDVKMDSDVDIDTGINIERYQYRDRDINI